MIDGTADTHPCKSGDIKTSNCPQHLKWLCLIKVIFFDGFLNYLLFFQKSRITESRAPSRYLLRPTAKKGGNHCTTCGGISNSHLSGGKNLITFFLILAHQIHSCVNSLPCFCGSHCRFFSKIPGAFPNGFLKQSRNFFRNINSDINGKYICSNRSCHFSYRRKSFRHLPCHGFRHFLPTLADAFFHDTIICTHDKYCFLIQTNLCFPCNCTNLGNESFKCSHSIQWLCHHIPILLYLSAHRFIRLRNHNLF